MLCQDLSNTAVLDERNIDIDWGKGKANQSSFSISGNNL